MKEEIKSKPKRFQNAHSTFRKNLPDYNDGANVSGRLGNDEEVGDFGSFSSGPEFEEGIGEIAYGNEEFFEENDVEDVT